MPDVIAHVGGKISKEDAEYEHPAKGANHCGICAYFEQHEPDHCSRVKGIIEAEDWCRLFKTHDFRKWHS